MVTDQQAKIILSAVGVLVAIGVALASSTVAQMALCGVYADSPCEWTDGPNVVAGFAWLGLVGVVLFEFLAWTRRRALALVMAVLTALVYCVWAVMLLVQYA